MPDGTPASAQFQADPRGDARIFCRRGYPGRWSAAATRRRGPDLL